MATMMSVWFFGSLQASVGVYYHGRRCSNKDPMNFSRQGAWFGISPNTLLLLKSPVHLVPILFNSLLLANPNRTIFDFINLLFLVILANYDFPPKSLDLCQLCLIRKSWEDDTQFFCKVHFQYYKIDGDHDEHDYDYRQHNPHCCNFPT